MVVAIATIFLTNSVLSSHISVVTLTLPLFISVALTLLWLRFVRLWYVLSTVRARQPSESLEAGEAVWSQVNLDMDTPSRDQPPAYDSPPGYEEAMSGLPCCQEKK